MSRMQPCRFAKARRGTDATEAQQQRHRLTLPIASDGDHHERPRRSGNCDHRLKLTALTSAASSSNDMLHSYSMADGSRQASLLLREPPSELRLLSRTLPVPSHPAPPFD